MITNYRTYNFYAECNIFLQISRVQEDYVRVELI